MSIRKTSINLLLSIVSSLISLWFFSHKKSASLLSNTLENDPNYFFPVPPPGPQECPEPPAVSGAVSRNPPAGPYPFGTVVTYSCPSAATVVVTRCESGRWIPDPASLSCPG